MAIRMAATIDLIHNEYLVKAEQVGDYALPRLTDIQSRHASIGQVRGMGLMIGVEFVKDQETRQPDEDLRDRIIHLAFQHGLLLLGCGKSTIRIAPPLSINRAEIDQGLTILEEVISKAEQNRMITHVA